jgi:hypothetical protein
MLRIAGHSSNGNRPHSSRNLDAASYGMANPLLLKHLPYYRLVARGATNRIDVKTPQRYANEQDNAHQSDETVECDSIARKEHRMKDFTIQLTHRPGELADVANALSLRGINIKSLAALNVGHQAVMRLIPGDVDAARDALHDKNIHFEENEVISILLENKAGELTGVASKLSEAGVNLQAIYLVGVAGDLIELAIAADDIKKAKKVLADLIS